MEIAYRSKYLRNDASSDQGAAPAFSRRWTARSAWRRLARGRRKLAARLTRRIGWISLQVRRRVFRVSSASDYQEVSDHRQPVRYDMSSYAKNFDDGEWKQEEEEYYSSRSFASRFGRAVDE